jgi:excisionase family DNA binding protein
MGRTDERSLSLAEAADWLGVHYMTAYRYVRTGKLDARQEHGEWRVRRRDLERFRSKPSVPARRGYLRWARHVERLYDRLVASDEAGAWQVLEQAMSAGAEPSDVYVRILGPALREIGDRWADGTIEVVDEHRASAVASRLIGRMGPRFARRGRRRGTVLVGAAPGDTHAMPVSMVADVLRGRGHRVVDLGGATPAESFVTEANAVDDLRAIGISAATTAGLRAATKLIPVLRAEVADVPVLLGGPAVATAAAARKAGADGWAPDAVEASDVLERLLSA